MKAPAPTAWPPVVSREAWTEARKALLAQEKALTRQRDAVNAARRRLPMVPVTQEYRFEDGGNGLSLRDLFGPHDRLIVGHFMFHPEWEKGCGACTWMADEIGPGRLKHLEEDDTAFVYVARAPWPKLAAYWKERDWNHRVVSSGNSSFNKDFGVTLDRATGHDTYNYAGPDYWEEKGFPLPEEGQMDLPGFSFFLRRGGEIFHTYSTFARGTETMGGSHFMLDMTVWGRRRDFEDSPEGWPQRPTYG